LFQECGEKKGREEQKSPRGEVNVKGLIKSVDRSQPPGENQEKEPNCGNKPWGSKKKGGWEPETGIGGSRGLPKTVLKLPIHAWGGEKNGKGLNPFTPERDLKEMHKAKDEWKTLKNHAICKISPWEKTKGEGGGKNGR